MRDLRHQNTALLMNFVHKLHQNEDLPWKAWYRSQSGRDLGDVSSHPSFIDSIVAHWLPLYRSITRCSVHDGEHVSFWLDNWLPGAALYILYPALFSHCIRPNISVADISRVGLPLQPRLSTIAACELCDVQAIIDGVSLDSEQDVRTMAWGADSTFSSRAVYHSTATGGQLDASAITSWGSRFPTKIKIFCYLADRDRLTSRANLFFKNCAPSDLCERCHATETCFHIFFVCPAAIDTWSMLDVSLDPAPVSIWDIVPPAALPVAAHVWRLGVAATLWSLWKARNDATFNATLTSAPRIHARSADDVALWGKRYPPSDRADINALHDYVRHSAL
ncbi:unnamed protein product [Alopecurus aequalis]